MGENDEWDGTKRKTIDSEGLCQRHSLAATVPPHHPGIPYIPTLGAPCHLLTTIHTSTCVHQQVMSLITWVDLKTRRPVDSLCSSPWLL